MTVTDSHWNSNKSSKISKKTPLINLTREKEKKKVLRHTLFSPFSLASCPLFYSSRKEKQQNYKILSHHLNYTWHLKTHETETDHLYIYIWYINNIQLIKIRCRFSLPSLLCFPCKRGSLFPFFFSSMFENWNYATAEMLQLLLSLLRQSKPSILTAAGEWPNFLLTQPLAAEEADGDWGAKENGL